MTRHRSVHTLLGTLFATAALVALVAPPASARIVERETFHDEFSGTNDNFCDAGIAVDFAGNRRRPLPGQLARPRLAWTSTSRRPPSSTSSPPPNGLTATDIQPNTINKDLSLVDDPEPAP